MSLDFTRQARIFNPKEQKLNIHIIGVGSIGSFMALNLAKLGFEDIRVYDFDKIEKENMPNQFYRIKDIGKQKVDCLKEIIKDFSDVDITTNDVKIDKDYEFDFDLNSIFIFAVDSMKVREMLFEKIKDFPLKILDVRMGGEEYQIYTCDLADEEDKERFSKKLNIKTGEESCGEKSIIYNILSIVSESCNILKMIDKSEKFPRVINRSMKDYKIFGGKKS